MKAALVLVDLQWDFLESAGMHPHRDQVVAGAARWLRHCRSMAMPVFHVWTTVNANLSNAMPHWKSAGRPRCVRGTPGHQVPETLAPIEEEFVLHKTGFSPFSDGVLVAELRRLGMDTLIVAGVHLHACVRQTALEAHQFGFRVLIADDAIGSDDSLHASITKRYLRDRGVLAVALREFVNRRDSCWISGIDKTARVHRIDTTVLRAEGALLSWRDLPVFRRLEMLEPMGSILRREQVRMAELITSQTGKPIRFSMAEVSQSADMADRIFSELRDWARPRKTATEFEVRDCPMGVVAVITPWNNPLYIPLGKLLPALGCGNAVVWKGAQESTKVSDLLLHWVETLGLPDGLVSLVQGGIDESCALMNHANVSAVTLTGSIEAGYAAMEICGTRHIPLQAELGGNNASVVWSDADLENAAKQISAGAFDMAGQRCTANRRVILHRNIADSFLEKLMSEVRALPWGDPLDSQTRIGPLVSDRRAAIVMDLIRRCEHDGLCVHYPLGSVVPGDPFAWVPPVIIEGALPGSEVVQTETFGPVLVVQLAENWDEAMTLCNGVKQGLVASLFSESTTTQKQFLSQAKAGIIKMNQTTAGAMTGAPFGGWKASGVGPPEHGIFDFQFFTRPQTVYGERTIG